MTRRFLAHQDMPIDIERLPVARWLKLGGGFRFAEHLGVFAWRYLPFIETPMAASAQGWREDAAWPTIPGAFRDRPNPQYQRAWLSVFDTLRSSAGEFDPDRAGWHRRDPHLNWWFGPWRVFVGMRGDWDGEFVADERGVMLAPPYASEEANGLLIVERGARHADALEQAREFRNGWESGRRTTFVG